MTECAGASSANDLNRIGEIAEMTLQEQMGGYANQEGLKISSYQGGFDVCVTGADQVNLADSLPRIKERHGRRVASFAVLDRQSEHFRNLDLEEKYNSSPYIVKVGVELYPVGRYGGLRCYTPAYEPEGTTLFVMVVRDETNETHPTHDTAVTIFRP